MRSKSFEGRILKLEKALDQFVPGQDIVNKLIGYLLSERLVTWIFETEFKRPDKFSPLDARYTQTGSKERRLAMQKWRQGRKQEWESTYWSHSFDSSGMVYVQGPDEPDLPNDRDARRIFNQILACLPLKVFTWSRHIAKKYYSRPNEFRVGRLSGYWFYAYRFLTVESRTRYWKRRIKNRNFEDIPLPAWAIPINKRNSTNINGKFPPLILPSNN